MSVCSGGRGQSVCVGGCQLDMEIRQNKQQFKHEHYIRGRCPAVMSACTRQIRPTKLCVCACVSARMCVSLCLCDAAD